METVEVKSPKTTCQAEVETEERPSSPVNDCAICLEQLTDKSFTNSCFHMFCFHCLKAWSKVKPECPLCKQDFCSIIHNIRSMDDYDEYRVPPAPMRFATPDSTSFFAQSFPNTLSLPFRDILRQRDFFSTSRRFFSYRTTYIPGPFNVPRERSSRLVIQPYVDNLQIQNNYPNISSSLSNSPNLSNRKDVYLKELELRPSNDGRHRISSPEFYRENEGQLHRLGRWINRELAALSQLGTHFNPNDVFTTIMDMLPHYDIQSTMFHSSLFPYLGTHTRRFIKEFYNFAISPHDMEEYDRMSVYVRQRTGSSLAFIVTVGSNESEDVQVIPSPPVSHSISPWITLPRCPTSSNYTSSILENSTRSSSSTSTCPHLPSATASSSSTSQQIIDISDSENDDCVIIDEVKITPQTIVLDDSDTESPNSGIAPRSPIPGTSGYRPPPKTTADDKNTLSMSNYVFELRPDSPSSEKSCPLSCFKNNSKKRSSSSSSVISTDNSIIDQETDVKLEPKNKKRKYQAKYRKTETHYESFEFSSSEFSNCECDNDDDSDWEANPKKKKKPKKHSNKNDKKTRKHKKVARSKSPKRKKYADTECSHKSKHVSKSRKSKKNSKNDETHLSTGSKSTSINGSVVKSSMHVDNFSPIRPKLRSVVKKVERNDNEDNLPSTSCGFRCAEINQSQIFIRRTFYSSDSD